MARLTVNGVAKELGAADLLAAVKELGFEPKNVVAELNRAIVEREKWEHTTLRDGDILELISFVGGG